jgi:hypothetical protein
VISRLRTWLREPFLIGPDDCPIILRWAIIGGASPSSKPLLFPGMKRWTLKVHRFMPMRDDRDVHDHPWPFVTIVLRGGYDDLVTCPYVRTEGALVPGFHRPGQSCAVCDEGLVVGDRMRAPAVRYRGPDYFHRTRSGPKGAWTIVVTGARLERPWGFLVDGVKWPWDRYLERFGDGMRCD